MVVPQKLRDDYLLSYQLVLSRTAALRIWIYRYSVTTISGYHLWKDLKGAVNILLGKNVLNVLMLSGRYGLTFCLGLRLELPEISDESSSFDGFFESKSAWILKRGYSKSQ